MLKEGFMEKTKKLQGIIKKSKKVTNNCYFFYLEI